MYQKEGRIPEALAALEKAAKHEKPAAPWVINWLSGQINARNGAFDEAIESFQSVLSTKIPERKIDLSLDYEVNNELAFALYARAMQEPVNKPRAARLPEEIGRCVSPYPFDRFRKRDGPSRPGPGLWRGPVGGEQGSGGDFEATTCGRAAKNPSRLRPMRS